MTGTWTALAHQPTFNASTMLLLTDGTVMCHDAGAGEVGTPNWWKLTPDSTGSYVAGTWSALANGPNSPQFFASAVLRDGRVFVAGGEYNGSNTQVFLATVEVYDPVANTWATKATPGWAQIGDAPSCVLPDGRVLLGSIQNNKTAIYDPSTNAWVAAGNKAAVNADEETWTLLPDETVLTAMCTGDPQTEKYVIAADRWVSAGSTISDLVETASNEIGPALLLPDGRVFAVGASGNTGLYTMPPIASQPGTWADGPKFPRQGGYQLGAKDAPAVLLPNGKVLCLVGGVDFVRNDFIAGMYFYEFNPSDNSLTAVSGPSASIMDTTSRSPYQGRFLLLPTGQALLNNGLNQAAIFTPTDGATDSSWRPQILTCPTSLHQGFSYTLHGRQLTGLSQACSYGDDAQMATNYPLVRIQNLATGEITFCRTHDFSSMAVATGSVNHSTGFTVPSGIASGAYQLCVVTNGISSNCITVGVGRKRWKEIKFEIKENIKREVDVSYKQIGDTIGKLKDAEGDPWQNVIEDPAWLEAVKTLAERSDQIMEVVEEQRAFIQESERPSLGDEVLIVVDEETQE